MNSSRHRAAAVVVLFLRDAVAAPGKGAGLAAGLRCCVPTALIRFMLRDATASGPGQVMLGYRTALLFALRRAQPPCLGLSEGWLGAARGVRSFCAKDGSTRCL